LGGTPQKNFGGEKHAKFGRFQTTSKFGGEYLQKDEDIQNRIFIPSTAIPPALGKTSPVEFGPVTLEISM